MKKRRVHGCLLTFAEEDDGDGGLAEATGEALAQACGLLRNVSRADLLSEAERDAAAAAASMVGNVIWSKDPPKEAGHYWVFSSDFDPALQPVELGHHDDGGLSVALIGADGSYDVGHFEWGPPVPRPALPRRRKNDK